MMYTFSSDDPVEKVLQLVEQVYGVQVEVTERRPGPPQDDPETDPGAGHRPKHDRT